MTVKCGHCMCVCVCCAQVIDPHTHEYVVVLKDEPVFLALAHKVADYLTRTGDMKNISRVCAHNNTDTYCSALVVQPSTENLYPESEL